MPPRPSVPADLERQLMVEAGHRCAIPTCRTIGPLEIEHIDDWAKVKEHKFSNMIVLCANCHGRKGNRRGQIDRNSLRQYKVNLAIVNSRYGEMERRVLDHFAAVKPAWNKAAASAKEFGEMQQELLDRKSEWVDLSPQQVRRAEAYTSVNFLELAELLKQTRVDVIQVARGTQFMLSYLIKDGLLRRLKDHVGTVIIDGQRVVDIYELTQDGHKFVDRWKTAQPLDDL